jgi:Anti-sigma-D factor RsdA to sigma factor binding region
MPDFGRWTSNGGDPSLNDINRTDRFLDSLGLEQPIYANDPGEAELAHMLAGWRDEVRDAPLTTAITPRDAVIAFDSARASRKRGRTLAIVGSAAAAVLCLGGFVSVVAGAGPGDSLYGLHAMFFGEKENTRGDAVMLASQQLAEVKQLIDEGQWDAAQQKLQTLTTTVATVNDVEQKQDLVNQWQQLTVKVEQQDPNATPQPGAPLPQMPDVPVVVSPGSDAATTTSTSSESSTPPSSDTTTSTSSSSESPTTTTSSPTTTPSSETTTTSATGTATSSATTSPVQQLPATVTTTTTTVSVPPQTRVQVQGPPPSTVAATTPQAPSVAPPIVPHIVVPTPSPAIVQPAPVHGPEAAVPPADQAPKSAPSTTVLMPEPGEKPN